MEDMEISFTLFGQTLLTVHETNDDHHNNMSPPLLARRRQQHSRIAQFRSDKPKDVETCDVSFGHVPMSFDDSKPHSDTLHDDETMSSYGRDCRRSKRVSFTSSKSRMSAVKKRSKVFFEKVSETTTTPLESGKQVRRSLFDLDNDEYESHGVGMVFDTDACSNHIIDDPCRHSSRRLPTGSSSSSLLWKKHSSLPGPIKEESRVKFAKCHSDAELLITSALSRSSSSDDHNNLVGDYSRPFRLPIIRGGKHEDLKAISHETMADVLTGRCSASVDDYIVVDCRYPYEYDAGHITGARNIYSKDEIFGQFLSSPSPQFLQKRPILIFHCEFSSERGPKLLRYLRNRDRSIHQENYPALYYPEVYLLEGGYKEFCQWHLDLCEPNGYKPMVHKDHCNELAFYRSKSRLYTSKHASQVSSDVAATSNERLEKQIFTSLRC